MPPCHCGHDRDAHEIVTVRRWDRVQGRSRALGHSWGNCTERVQDIRRTHRCGCVSYHPRTDSEETR